MTDTPPATDTEKLGALRRMKRVATALFVAATVLFLVARAAGDGEGWMGALEAFAEAAMVGALADWFAVTALFRHPLRIPIPHTAIIPKRKDQIGRSLGEFVQSEFLSSEVIVERLRGFHLTERFGGWLVDPAHAERAAEAAAEAIRAGLEVLDDADVQRALEQLIERRVRATPAAPLIGRAIELAVEGGHHQRMLDSLLGAGAQFLEDNRSVLRGKLGRESPWWVPEPIDDRIFTKLLNGFQSFLGEVRTDPDHELRRSIEARLVELRARLDDDPELLARGEALKEELLAHPAVRAWLGSLWGDLRASLLRASADPSSDLRTRLTGAMIDLGRRLGDDPALAEKIDGWVEGAVAHLLVRYRTEVADLIASTVERWDADATSAKLELQVGRDLQFIRINGTLVGGLAGLAIHGIGLLIG